MSSPSNTIRPLVGRITPVRELKNVDLPAPLGPMIPRISPRGTEMLTLLTAARPPNRTVRASVWRSGVDSVSVDTLWRMTRRSRYPGTLRAPMPLGELAGRRDERLLLGDGLQELVLVVLDREDELAQERLVIFLPDRLVALREIVAFLHFQAFQGLDQIVGVLAAAEAGLLHAELQEVHRLEVRLHVAVRQRARWVDLLELDDGLIEELLVVRRVQRRVHHRDVPVDADEALDLLPQRRQMRRLRDGAVAGVLVLLRQAEIVDRVREADGVGAEENAEETVEVAADLRDEGRHVGRPERNAGGAHDFATVLLDLLDVRVSGRLAPRIVEEPEMPLLAELADQIRRDRDRLGRRVIERPEDVAAALGGRDGRVETDADHPDGLVLLEDRHARQAYVGEIAALRDVDLVLEYHLLGLAAADVGLGLVVRHHQLDGTAVDAAGMVDAIHGHLRADQRGLAAGRARARERLEHAHLVRLGLAERLTPRCGNQHCRAQGAGRRRRQRQEFAPRRLAAPPHVLRPGFVVPPFSHRIPPYGAAACQYLRHGHRNVR